MYLHIGRDMIVPQEEIVAIIDIDLSRKSDLTREFLQVAEVEGALQAVAKDEEPKSCIITTSKVYLSSISSATLLKRAESGKLNLF
ncbi:hypothetical protein SY88_07630 [Clostridiales bacterium PH28_bin88]|nr:hypothetical protein SY88_07630 [Clostridiales bacterium PH28_bin88]